MVYLITHVIPNLYDLLSSILKITVFYPYNESQYLLSKTNILPKKSLCATEKETQIFNNMKVSKW